MTIKLEVPLPKQASPRFEILTDNPNNEYEIVAFELHEYEVLKTELTIEAIFKPWEKGTSGLINILGNPCFIISWVSSGYILI